MKTTMNEENICIFVANLPSVLSNFELVERIEIALSPFGSILSVKASRDRKNRPFAFVQFQGPVIDFMLTETVVIEDRVLRFEKAKSNIGSSLNSENIGEGEVENPNAAPYYPQVHPQVYIPYYTYGLNSQQIHTFQVPNQPLVMYPHGTGGQVYPPAPVHPMSPPDSVSTDSSSFDEMNKIFVGHLNGELVTQRKLLRHFQRYGHITDIELFKNNLDGTLRPDAFAFISYLKPEQMLQAIKEENGREWLGKQLKCCKALKKREGGVQGIEGEVHETNPNNNEELESEPALEHPLEPEPENVQVCLSASSI